MTLATIEKKKDESSQLYLLSIQFKSAVYRDTHQRPLEAFPTATQRPIERKNEFIRLLQPPPIMMRSSTNSWRLSAFVVLALLAQSGLADWTNPFSDFFGEYNEGFQNILRTNCSTEYIVYLQNRHNTTILDQGLQQFNEKSWATSHDVINCMLRATPELIKSKMATADILLGLLPSMLAMVGVQVSDTAIIAVVAKKPFLTFLLAFGSPAVNAYRSTDYKAAVEELSEHSYGKSIKVFGNPWAKFCIHTVVYLLACLSIANVAELAWELGGRIIFLILPDDQYMVLLWAFLGLMVHALAAFGLHALVEVRRGEDASEYDSPVVTSGEEKRRHGWRHILGGPSRWYSAEFGSERDSKMFVHMAPDSLLFYAWAWFTAIYTTMHIIFGTALFASALFISVADALTVMARLIGSAILCRLLVKVELLLLKARVRRRSEYGPDVPQGQLQVDPKSIRL